MTRQESHRIYLQLFAPDPKNTKASDGGATSHRHGSHDVPQPSSENSSPTLVTTSAAVRLTDKATAKDVTALLRGKFGLPPIMTSGGINNGSNNPKQRDHPPSNTAPPTTRSSQVQGDGINVFGVGRGGGTHVATDPIEANGGNDVDEVDALVLIGTMERPPRGYLRFEHEESHEEAQRLEKFRRTLLREQERGRGTPERTLPRPSRADGPPAETDFVGNHELYATESSHSSSPPDTTKSIQAPRPLGSSRSSSSSSMQATFASGVDANMNPSGSLLGFDPSHEDMLSPLSRRYRKLTTLASELSVASSHSPPIVDRELSPPQSRPKSPNPSCEFDLEPIHIVRTVLPDEHPLLVRDEVMTFLTELRQEAQDEMGFRLMDEEEGCFRSRSSRPTFRWYFQPCSPLGRHGSFNSPKIQCIPAFVYVDGYCTEDESESDFDEGKDLELDEVREDVMDISGGAEKKTQHSQMRRQLIEERRRIAFLRDLTDPPFIVSGYLLKQSWRDPNVWKRVYCILSEDRMWIIGRMKPLKRFGRASSDDILSFVRTGSHRYFMLYQSQLLGRGDEALIRQHSSSKYSGYFLTPLNRRLPNSFRVITSQGKCHTFRAFSSQLFRLWVTSISDRIAQKLDDGIIDLANVIAEEETMARCRRMDGVAVSPLELHYHASTELKSISMDVVRFGISVAAFSELCRHVNNSTRQSSAINAETRHLNAENEVMISSVWDEARVITSKSAQLIHTLATLQHDDSDMKIYHSAVMRELVEEQKSLQALIGEKFDHQGNIMSDMALRVSSLPPVQFFDPLLRKIQVALVRINDGTVPT
ncbi:hypothetical protein ACHAXA_007654 [Cyclostephanos tholiformis]|uniref:PH domain-containing protein n=1 Tax=Cyclostephanos tholiformis TaxID=382380 RepID=A0ABD3SDS9_9STRA